MSTYYVASNGQQQGPFAIAEIQSMLEAQKLNWHDYIYDDKTEDWVLLMEYSALTDLFNKSFENPIKKSNRADADVDPLKSRIWFVLKQNNNYGPFSKTELIQMLQSDTLQEYDFIWHEKMQSWKRLSEVNEFSMDEIKNIYKKLTTEAPSDPELANAFYRRKYNRAKYNSHAIIHDKQKVYKSISVEISEGGAGLLIEDANFKKGEQIYLHIKPGHEVPAFNAICKVVSIKGNLYGVQFMKISVSAKNSIAKFTNKKAA